MTDREMLEYAAKAAGIEIDLVAFSDGSFICYHKGNAFSWDASNEWNPLIDDGEALRLAPVAVEDLLLRPDFYRACARELGQLAAQSSRRLRAECRALQLLLQHIIQRCWQFIRRC